MRLFRIFKLKDGANHDTFDRGKIPCLGQRLVQEYMMDYIEQLFANYQDIRVFAVANWMTNHEQTLHRGRTLDIPMRDFLKKLDKQGVLNNTILFLASDHGSHSKFLLEMLEGRLEHRNPPFYVVVPKWLCEQYPKLCENLEYNTKHLFSAHDIYATLRHIPIWPGKNLQGKSTHNI